MCCMVRLLSAIPLDPTEWAIYSLMMINSPNKQLPSRLSADTFDCNVLLKSCAKQKACTIFQQFGKIIIFCFSDTAFRFHDDVKGKDGCWKIDITFIASLAPSVQEVVAVFKINWLIEPAGELFWLQKMFDWKDITLRKGLFLICCHDLVTTSTSYIPCSVHLLRWAYFLKLSNFSLNYACFWHITLTCRELDISILIELMFLYSQ